MELLAAAVLGIVQGLTEFLPISSSAHLILVPWLFGWKPEGIVFDVSLHIGTAVAILAYFWREWWTLATEMIQGLRTGQPFGNGQRKLGWFLIVGTLPAAILGVLFEKQVEEALRSPLVTVFTLAALGLVLYLADRVGRKERVLDQFTLGDSICIGLSQALALIPGVSRSGITISTALFRNADRASAARFSFLMATPVIVGAGVLQGWHLVRAIHHPALANLADTANPTQIAWSVLCVGILFSTVTGFLCIRYFLRYLKKGSFLPFVIYRFVLAAIVLMFYFRFL